MEFRGSIHNARGFNDLLSQSGSIVAAPTAGPIVISATDMVIHGPKGAITTNNESEPLRVKMYRRALGDDAPENLVQLLEDPHLRILAGQDVNLEIQMQPDQLGRAQGIDRLEGASINLGLMAWESGVDTHYVVTGFSAENEENRIHGRGWNGH